MHELIEKLKLDIRLHNVSDVYMIIADVITVLEAQDNAIQGLASTVASHNRTIANLQAEINRLKGVHGA